MRKFIFNGMNIGYIAPDRAQDVSYDNSGGGLSSTNMQDAIDEINNKINGYVEVIGTLLTGETSITLSDSSITTNSTFDLYTDSDIPYNDKTVTTGSVTYTFDAQATDTVVKVRVS